MHTRPQSNYNRADSCSWFCRRYAKSTYEESRRKWYIKSECFQSCILYVKYPKFREYWHLNHLLPTLFCPVKIPFEDCDVCVCIVALDVLAACKVAACWRAMLILLAISCNIRQRNLDLTSSLYRCNSTGASIPLLDYREGVTAYANFTLNTPLPKQTRHLFPYPRVCVRVFVCVYKWGRAMQMACMYPVCQCEVFRMTPRRLHPPETVTDWR